MCFRVVKVKERSRKGQVKVKERSSKGQGWSSKGQVTVKDGQVKVKDGHAGNFFSVFWGFGFRVIFRVI